MPIPAVAAAALPAIGGQVVRVLDKPVIGWSSTKTKVTKKGAKTTSAKFELRGWEVGGLALGVAGAMTAAYALGMWRWEERQSEQMVRVYTGGVPPYYMARKTIKYHVPVAGNYGNDQVGIKALVSPVFGPLGWGPLQEFLKFVGWYP